jgi:hypothetical protein
MIELCSVCKDILICKRLCNKAELYVNQDNVSQNYALLGNNDIYVENQKWPVFQSSAEVILRMFYKEHKRGYEIAKKLKVSKQYVSEVRRNFKPLYEKKILKIAKLTPII